MPFRLNFLQEDRGVWLIGLDDIIRVGNYIRHIGHISLVVLRMVFFDMLDPLIRQYNFVRCDIF